MPLFFHRFSLAIFITVLLLWGRFYCKTLAPLGIDKIIEVGGACGFETHGKAEF